MANQSKKTIAHLVTSENLHSSSLVHHLTSQHLFLYTTYAQPPPPTPLQQHSCTALSMQQHHARRAAVLLLHAHTRSAHHAGRHAHTHTHTPYNARNPAPYTARKREKSQTSKSAPKKKRVGGKQKKAPSGSPAGVGGTPDLTCCSCVFCCGLEPAVAA